MKEHKYIELQEIKHVVFNEYDTIRRNDKSIKLFRNNYIVLKEC
jgi:hypothetical protein